MRGERACCCTAGIFDQHRRLDFHESALIEVTADRGNDLRALDEHILRTRIHDQVDIALTIAQICVRESVELLRKDLKTLGKKGDLLCMNGSLTLLRRENESLHTDDIAHVEFLKCRIILTEVIAGYIDLDVAVAVLHICEGSLAHDALLHQTSCDGHFLTFEGFIVVKYLFCMLFLIVRHDLKGILSLRNKIRELLAAYLPQLIEILRCCAVSLIPVFGHVRFSPFITII